LTFNRAAIDSIYATTLEVPYMAKTFFFAAIDKISNLLKTIGRVGDSEEQIWKRLVSKEFIQTELATVADEIPGPIGDDYRSTVQWSLQILNWEQTTPELLRAYRNSLHGYHLRNRDVAARLFYHSGQVNNDLTLLAALYIHYVLGLDWSKASHEDST
jgi:hypothetical protein